MPRNTTSKTTATRNTTSRTATNRSGSTAQRSGTSQKAGATKSTGTSQKTGATQRTGSSQRTATAMKSDETMLMELFLDELKDIYWAEKHLIKTMPKLRKACTSEELASAFERHMMETENQVGRVEQVFDMMDMSPRAKKCEAMEGLVKEALALLEDLPKGTMARDAGLIISAQKVEHYEIAAYGSLVQLAKTMGENEIADILAVTLEEEKRTDQILTDLAVSGINLAAQREPEQNM